MLSPKIPPLSPTLSQFFPSPALLSISSCCCLRPFRSFCSYFANSSSLFWMIFFFAAAYSKGVPPAAFIFLSEIISAPIPIPPSSWPHSCTTSMSPAHMYFPVLAQISFLLFKFPKIANGCFAIPFQSGYLRLFFLMCFSLSDPYNLLLQICSCDALRRGVSLFMRRVCMYVFVC